MDAEEITFHNEKVICIEFEDRNSLQKALDLNKVYILYYLS
jgi:hypothetical protein